MIRPILTFSTAALLVTGLEAQVDPSFQTLELRVVSSPSRGRATVDRGRVDLLQLGDEIELFPRQGGRHRGRIVELGERTSLVELVELGFAPAPGTRGEARIPKSRIPAVQTRPSRPSAQPVDDPLQPASRPEVTPTPDHPPWPNQDPGFTKDKTLLAQSRAVRPSERPLTWSLRTYAFGDVVKHPESDYDESFLRLGADLRVDNPANGGGTFHMNAELARRQEYDGDTGAPLTLRALSYAWGGDRFAADRFEAGRFLQRDMPEFGTLDGFQWTRRLENNNRFGASIGFMPRPDDGFDGTSDMQLSVYHVWQLDAFATTQFSAGFQQTFHDGDIDRDLLVLKGHHLPNDEWQADATLWIDLYDGSDAAGGPGVGLTQAVASLSRTWKDGNRVDFSFRHLQLPEIDRFEFLNLTPQQLADDRADKLAAEVWLQSSRQELRWRGYLAAWNDEGHTGGAAEVGLERRGWLAHDSNTRIDLFLDTAEFTSVFGARADWAANVSDGRWNLFYEISRHHQVGFPSDRDDLMQHRVRVSRTLDRVLGFDLELHAQLQMWGDDLAWDLGFTFQRKFGSVPR